MIEPLVDSAATCFQSVGFCVSHTEHDTHKRHVVDLDKDLVVLEGRHRNLLDHDAVLQLANPELH